VISSIHIARLSELPNPYFSIRVENGDLAMYWRKILLASMLHAFSEWWHICILRAGAKNSHARISLCAAMKKRRPDSLAIDCREAGIDNPTCGRFFSQPSPASCFWNARLP